MKSFVSLISKPFKKEDTGKIIPSSSPTSTASLNTIISSPVIAVSNGTPNTSSKIPSSPSNMNNDTINTSQKITTVASNNNSVYYTRDIDSSIDDSTHLCPPSNGVLAAAALKSSEPQEKADSEFVPINRQNSFSYDSVNQPKADWNDIELRCENAKQAILGYGSFGTVIKAYWKHPSHFKLNHEDCYKDETCRDGEIVVAIKLFTRGLTGPEDLNITKLYQQACDEVNLVKSAEQRMFDTSRIVQAFGIAKGPLTAEMCRVFRVQEGEESIGILMRYEAGGALEHIVHNSSKTTLPMTGIERIRLLLEIAQGIAELHSSGIVHADIKLDNVLLSHHRPPKVRLADFGLSIFKSEEESKLGNSALMMTRHLRGTPIYCAPELLTNPFEQSTNTETIIAKPSRKTDMYAFAIVAWEILSQNQPFAEIRAEGELCTRVHQGHRPPVSELPTDTSPNILAMIESCWDKDRNARKTAVECVRLLQYEYVSLKKGVFDIYFSHASVPKLLLSHIYYYFVRLGCTVSTGLGFSSLTEPLSPTSYLNTPCTFSEDSLNSKLVILCFDKEYQQSLRCMRELEEFKHTYPDKQILTLVVEEKLMAWANERSKEMLLLQSPAHTVDIGHIGRAHWESDEGPDAAMLVALTKNLEPLRELVIKSECVSLTGQLTQGSRLGSTKSAVASSTSKSRAETSRMLSGLELCVAVYDGDLTYLRGLLESGCPVNACDYDFRTAAHICCADNLVQAALILYEFKADFTSDSVRDRWGRTPIEEAENHRHLHLAAALRSIQGAEKERQTVVMMEDESGVFEKQNCVGLELCVAAFDGDEAYLRALLESGCPVGATDYDHRTAAHIACAENNTGIVQILSQFNAEFHSKKVKDRYGNTPLMEAEKHGHIELAEEVKRIMEEQKSKKSDKKVSGK